MFSRISKGLVLGLSLAACTVAVGCAGTAEENVGSDEGAATSSAALAHDYEGTIGNLKVLLRLDAQGSALSGSYFYADKVGNGDNLVLKGSLSGSKLSLTESVNGAGAATGTFAGDVSASGIKGTWKAGSTSLPLNLTPIKALKVATHKYLAEKKAPAGVEYARDCRLEVEAVEIFGIAPAAQKAMMDSLKVDPLDVDDKGQCESDIRYVTHEIFYNANGFLTIHVNSEWDGGAHPENGSEYFNFSTADGKRIGPDDIFKAGSKAAIKDLVEKQMRGQVGKDGQTEEDVKAQIEEFETHFSFDPESQDISGINMGVGEKGLEVDFVNSYPHVILALAPFVSIPWSDIKPLLKDGSPVAPLAK